MASHEFAAHQVRLVQHDAIRLRHDGLAAERGPGSLRSEAARGGFDAALCAGALPSQATSATDVKACAIQQVVSIHRTE